MKKIYIAWCGGMLWEAFYEQFKNDYELKCTDKDVNDSWLSFLDFRDFEAYKKDVNDFKPDYLFHLWALTDLEYCEKNSDDAYMSNTLSVENACYIANELNIPLLYICTAWIFDWKEEIYDDRSKPNPLWMYARSKYQGEVFVQQNVEKHLICRAWWMMWWWEKKDKKFISKIIKQIKAWKKELFIVNDKTGTPTYTHDFAKNVKLLLEKEYRGLYNMVCEGLTDRLEVTKELISLLWLQNDIKISEVDSTFFAKEYFAPRPDCERLVNTKLSLRWINMMRNRKIALKEYIETYYPNLLKK